MKLEWPGARPQWRDRLGPPRPHPRQVFVRPQRGGQEVAGTGREKGHRDNVFWFS